MLDQPVEHLGEKLSLPPAFEHLRDEVTLTVDSVEHVRVEQDADVPAGVGDVAVAVGLPGRLDLLDALGRLWAVS